jgi:large subunit ribosomal protein L5
MAEEETKKTVKAAAPKADKAPKAPKVEKVEKPVKPVKAVAPKAVKAEKAEVAKEAPKAEVKVEAKPEAKIETQVEAKPEVKKAVAPAKAEQKKAEAKPAKSEKKEVVEEKYENRLIKKYRTEVVPALVKQFKYSSYMQAPRLEKIVINIGVGDATVNAKALEDSVNDLTTISGQHPVVTKAKKSIATFKVREGQAIGCKVTLRGLRMYEFFDKLVSVALPRVRDFRGINKNSFDGHGNYTLGIKEQLIFPEIDYDKVSKIRGMDIVVVTTAQSDAESYALLSLMGMPFRK